MESKHATRSLGERLQLLPSARETCSVQQLMRPSRGDLNVSMDLDQLIKFVYRGETLAVCARWKRWIFYLINHCAWLCDLPCANDKRALNARYFLRAELESLNVSVRYKQLLPQPSTSLRSLVGDFSRGSYHCCEEKFLF